MFDAMARVNLIKKDADMKELEYSKAGRTDKQVSAAGNVIAIKLFISEAEEKDLVKRINSALPDDIMLTGSVKVDLSFDARHSCRGRHYKHFFFTENLDLDKMREAAKLLEGKHDFRRFCKMQPKYKENGTERTIFEASIVETKESAKFLPMAYFNCRGSGFLWHQVSLSDSLYLIRA